MEWEKIFVNHVSDEGLIFERYKEFMQLNRKNFLNGQRIQRNVFPKKIIKWLAGT